MYVYDLGLVYIPDTCIDTQLQLQSTEQVMVEELVLFCWTMLLVPAESLV